MIKQYSFLLKCLFISISFFPAALLAFDEIEIPVLEQDIFVSRFPAQGEQLIIWVAAGYGSNSKALEMAGKLAEQNIEVWRIDLADSLFLPRGTSMLRNLTGKYVAGLIEQAHTLTGKRITLIGRSYAAIPILKGARQWQQQAAKNSADAYFNGAILFSPELYAEVPALGLEAVYEPIMSATNIPVMIYQSANRGNRWQLNRVLSALRSGGAEVYMKVLNGVTGVFYRGDKNQEMFDVLNDLPSEIVKVVTLLQKTTMPITVPSLIKRQTIESRGLDTALKSYRGNAIPAPIDLLDISGRRIRRENYKGKVTVVNFWATWCPPCVEEIPSLNRLRKAMQGKDFELISIDYAEDEKRVKKFLQRVDVDFPVLMDSDGKVSAEWGTLVFPSTFVIGPDGKIQYGVNGGIAWDSPEVIKKLNDMLEK